MAVTLHYRTGWSSPSAHVSADHGASWMDVALPSLRTSPIGPSFRVVELPAAPLRFVLTDGVGGWDNPSSACSGAFCDGEGGNYIAEKPGSYVLYDGVLTKHESVLKTPELCMVTDIDGTLHGCRDSLVEFCELWQRKLALSGALLVYNTGRGINSVMELVRDEGGVMPVPVAAVTRVGGFVHWFRGAGKTMEGTGEWADFDGGVVPREDKEWRKVLRATEGFDENCMPECRRLAQRVIDAQVLEADGEDVAHWLYDGVGDMECTQISLTATTGTAYKLHESLKEGLAHLPVKFIVSGGGNWRYFDITVQSGGKLGGTVYVVSRLAGVSIEHTVFSGDSGNDIDNLLGDTKGIVVGNSQGDLLEAVELKGKSDFEVVLCKEWFARGIVEGLGAHGFL